MVKTMNKIISGTTEPVIVGADDSFHNLVCPASKGRFLRGTRAIAKFVFDTDDKAAVRSTFHILESSSSIPAFKQGGMWWVRISSLNAKIWAQEKRAWQTQEQETLARLHIVLSMLLPSLVAIDRDLEDDELSSSMSELVAEAVKTIVRLLHTGTL